MIISVIGSGALGKTYGGLLALAGHDVHFLERSDYATLKKTDCYKLVIKDIAQTLTVKHLNIYSQSTDLPPSDIVIIALKTTANDQIEALLSSCLKNNSIVLIIQNGIGSEEVISDFTGKCPIICAIATIGAGRREDANAAGVNLIKADESNAVEVDISFLGNLKLAPYLPEYQPACEQVKAAFQSSPLPLPITLHVNYREIRWLKLGWNIPFGALSLIFDQPTNTLAREEPYQSLVLQLMAEIRKIAKADGVEIPEAIMQQWVEFTKDSGPYMTTIYRDFHAGNAIEKAYLFDHVLTIAKQKNCNAPLLTLIEKQLSTLLANRGCN